MAISVTRPTFGGATGNSYSSTTTQVTDSQIRYVDDMLEYLEVDDFPIQKAIGYGEPVNVRKLEWGDRRRAPSADQLNEALDDSETGVDVDNGARFQVGNLIKVDDEVMWVSAISTNTLTVTRAWGSTAATHADNATVRIIGVAMPENFATPAAPIATGEFFYNYFQLFDSGIQISNRANANGEANYLIRRKEYNQRVEEKFIEKAEQLEYTLIHGTRVDATSTTPSSMGGIPAFITTQVTDLGDAALTKQTLRALWQSTFLNVGKVHMAKTMLMGTAAKSLLNTFYDPARRLSGSDKSVTEMLDAVETDFGRMTFVMHYHMPADEIYGVNLKNLSIHPFGDYGRWHDKRLPEDGPYMKGRITGDYCLEAKGDRAHFKVIDILAINSTNYPSLQD